MAITASGITAKNLPITPVTKNIGAKANTVVVTAVATEDHGAALSRLIADIQTRLLGVTVMARLGNVDLGDVDLTDVRRLVRLARDATRAGTLSYGLITAVAADRP